MAIAPSPWAMQWSISSPTSRGAVVRVVGVHVQVRQDLDWRPAACGAGRAAMGPQRVVSFDSSVAATRSNRCVAARLDPRRPVDPRSCVVLQQPADGRGGQRRLVGCVSEHQVFDPGVRGHHRATAGQRLPGERRMGIGSGHEHVGAGQHRGPVVGAFRAGRVHPASRRRGDVGADRAAGPSHPQQRERDVRAGRGHPHQRFDHRPALGRPLGHHVGAALLTGAEPLEHARRDLGVITRVELGCQLRRLLAGRHQGVDAGQVALPRRRFAPGR